jgi:anti-sigma B factor antagonist
MQFHEVREERCVILQLAGEIDLQHSPRMRELLQSKVAERTPVLILDFREVAYIDSSGLATLVEYYQKSRSYCGQLALVGLSQRVRSIFDLVRLHEVFSIYADTAEAKAAAGLHP